MSELAGAKISRGMLRGSAERKIQLLREAFGKLQKVDIGQVTLDQTTELQGIVATWPGFYLVLLVLT